MNCCLGMQPGEQVRPDDCIPSLLQAHRKVIGYCTLNLSSILCQLTSQYKMPISLKSLQKKLQQHTML